MNHHQQAPFRRRTLVGCFASAVLTFALPASSGDAPFSLGGATEVDCTIRPPECDKFSVALCAVHRFHQVYFFNIEDELRRLYLCPRGLPSP